MHHKIVTVEQLAKPSQVALIKNFSRRKSYQTPPIKAQVNKKAKQS